jgi:hypothetical protein
MSKINRFAAPAFALAGILSVGPVVGLAQTKTNPAQPEPGANAAQPVGPGYGPMMGGWGPGMGYGGMGPSMMGRGGPAMCAAMAGHVDARLAYVKTALKITEAQEPLWKAYAEAARDNAQGMQARCTTMMSSKGAGALSLPDRIDLHEQFMAARLESLKAMGKALKLLYASFSDEQKKTADEIFWGPMGMMGMM